MHYEKFHDGTVKCIEDEIPFELPQGWAFLRLQSFVSFVGGNQPPKSTFEYKQTNDNIRLIQIRDYKTDKFKTFIPKDKAKRFCSATDIMIGRYGPPIFQILRGLEGAYNVALMKAIPDFSIMTNEYLYYLLQDGELLYMLEGLSDRTCGQDGINMYELNRYIVGIPPIAEQNRIVEFLNNYIPIVDYIKNEREELLSFLQLTKSKILDLAIRGKLVPQDPNDEPASVLLDRIRAEKEELIKQGKIKRDKKESFIFKGEDNSYYGDIPDNWEVASISQLNYYQSSSVNPLLFPDEYFELFSVPNYDIGIPEIVKGNEIGSTKQSVESKDVLLCKINPRINRVWTVTCVTEYKTIASSEWIVFRNPFLYSPYVTIYLSSPLFRELLLTNVSGVGGSLMRAQPDSVKKYPVVIPPYEEQKRIADKVSQLFSLLDSIAENVN